VPVTRYRLGIATATRAGGTLGRPDAIPACRLAYMAAGLEPHLLFTPIHACRPRIHPKHKAAIFDPRKRPAERPG
jgi:hypothetical protein